MAKAPALPAAYAWLAHEATPRVLVEALALYGTKETPGAASNPAILGWAREVGVAGAYVNNGIAWCGLFVATVTKRAGIDPVANPLWARNWAGFGTKADKAGLGDVLVFERPGGGGHVGLYVGEDATGRKSGARDRRSLPSGLRSPRRGRSRTGPPSGPEGCRLRQRPRRQAIAPESRRVA